MPSEPLDFTHFIEALNTTVERLMIQCFDRLSADEKTWYGNREAFSKHQVQ